MIRKPISKIEKQMRFDLNMESSRRKEVVLFAIFESGGSQHKVKVGDQIVLQKLNQEIGSTICFDQISLISVPETEVILGEPWVSGAQIEVKVLRQYRDKKIRIIKFRRRKHSMKKQGHRQSLTEVEVLSIKHAASH